MSQGRHVRRRLGHRKCHQKVSSRFLDHDPTPQSPQSASGGGRWRTRQLLIGSTVSLKKGQCQLSVAANWSSAVDQVYAEVNMWSYAAWECVKKQHAANEWHICHKCTHTYTHAHAHNLNSRFLHRLIKLYVIGSGFVPQKLWFVCTVRCTGLWAQMSMRGWEWIKTCAAVMNGIVGNVLTINPVSVALD